MSKRVLILFAAGGLTVACNKPNGAFMATDGGTDGDSDSGSTGSTASATASATVTASGGTSAGSDSDSGGTGSTSGVTAGTDSGGTTGGPQCFDDDGDGVKDCDGDCDDTDPFTYPGADEICGDGVDNACGGNPDPDSLCMGLGTWVSQITGDDTNPGTQLSPVKTIGKGMQNAGTIGGGMDVFVGEGIYNEAITLVEGISLFGGHQCDGNACDWTWDPGKYLSKINNTSHNGVVADSTITRDTEVSGFEIKGQDGDTTQGGNIAAITVLGGTPSIVGNKIVGANVGSCGGGNWCGTSAVRVDGTSNDSAGVLVGWNDIQGGTSPSSTCGIDLVNYQSPPVLEAVGNYIKGGNGNWTRGVCAFASGAGTYIGFNDIDAGSTSGANSSGSSFALFISGNPYVEGNRLNVGSPGTCASPSPTFWCGGLESEGASATIVNNIIHAMDAPRNTALFMGDGEVPFGELVINGNTLRGAMGSLSTSMACRTSQGTNAKIGRIRNNILVSGSGTSRFGFYEENQASGKTCEPSLYENNNVFFTGPVSGTDVVHRRWSSQAIESLLDLAGLNALGFATANFSADCLLDGNDHLGAGSPCIDAGTASEAPSEDIDGEPRPQGAGIDVGADEAG